MRKTFFFTFLFLNYLVKAQISGATAFRWQVISENPPKGKCFEMDVATGGRTYLKQAPQEKCRPKKKEDLLTLWNQNPEGPGGRCYLVDKQTAGKQFSKTVSIKNCEPSEVETHLIDGKCYLKGVTPDESVYLVSAPKERCKPGETIIVFLPAPSGLYGRCVSKDVNTGATFNEPMKKCRPDDVTFVTLLDDGEHECFEVASEGGAARYVKKVNKKNCRPDEVSYVWAQTEENEGQCFLLGQGGSYREKVPYKKCVGNYEVGHSFEIRSPTFGRCLLIDEKTGGQQFRQVVPVDECRPEVTEYKLVRYLEKPYCLTVDSSDPVRGFRKSISLKYCHDNKKTFIWRPDNKKPMKGRCEQLYFLGEEARFKNTKAELCRPEETVPLWFVESEKKVLLARCYEVAREGGPETYVKKVSRKFCKPKAPNDKLVLKYFHPSEYERGGCYFVDSQTLGGRYSVRTDDKKCKQEMFQKKP